MSRTLTISKQGLKLIKAFEGYRPVDRETVTGQRVVGYGHRLYSDDAVQVTKAQAEELLRTDLHPFEDMVAEEVHAPLSQSQFDALCSFAYSIGPRAFLQSDTLRALNNGRPLDAANGLDIWRKSEIDGKTYVVDALVRRRTAEKALFLKLGDGETLPADRVGLPAQADETVALLSTEDALPVFTQDDANGVVATAPYDATTPAFSRRREDGPAGVLELSEVAFPDDDLPQDSLRTDFTSDTDISDDADLAFDLDDVVDNIDEAGEVEPVASDPVQTRESPIAAAATDIVDRLEALIDNAGPSDDDDDDDNDWPESLITPAVGDPDMTTADDMDSNTDETSTAASTKPARSQAVANTPVAVIDDLAADDAMREGRETAARNDSAGRYIRSSTPLQAVPATPARQTSDGLAIPIILGLVLMGASLSALLSGADALLGEWGPMLAFSAMLIGGLMFVIALYYALRNKG